MLGKRELRIEIADLKVQMLVNQGMITSLEKRCHRLTEGIGQTEARLSDALEERDAARQDLSIVSARLDEANEKLAEYERLAKRYRIIVRTPHSIRDGASVSLFMGSKATAIQTTYFEDGLTSTKFDAVVDEFTQLAEAHAKAAGAKTAIVEVV